MHFEFTSQHKQPTLSAAMMIDVIRRIEEKSRECLGCVVVSRQIDDKNVSVGIVYLMVRCGMDLQECLEFMRMKRPEYVMSQPYYRMLQTL